MMSCRIVSTAWGSSVRKSALLLAALIPFGAGRLAAQSGKYVVVVNPRNPAVSVSTSDLSRMYLGKVQGWKMNGRVEPLVPLDQRPDSPLRAVFTERVLHRSVQETLAYWRQEVYAGRNFPPVEQSEDENLSMVREMVGAIAYVSANADLRGVKVVRVQ
jgi:ABC-type phosphate transport system substrate-binding protein